MTVHDFSPRARASMEKKIRELISVLCDDILRNTEWAPVLKRHLGKYMLGGKLFRAASTLFWAQCYGAREDDDLYALASVSEFLQTFLLIHDDIMDEDDLRRNMPSMHVLFSRHVEHNHARENALLQPEHIDRLGEALAMCVGDVVFSYSFHILAQHMSAAHLPLAIEIFSSYVCKVGEAQMRDMAWEAQRDMPDADSIRKMYIGKTGYYSFSLPAVLGYLYAANGENTDFRSPIAQLDEIGAILGQLFQIRDDIIDFVLDEDVSGKTRGSDIVRGKKTFFLSLLHQAARREGKKWEEVVSMCVSPSKEGLNNVKRVADELQVWKKIDEVCEKLYADLRQKVEGLNISKERKEAVMSFAHYLVCRNR